MVLDGSELTPQEEFVEEAISPWSGCEKCEDLVKDRSCQVFGVGNPSADIFVIGTAPGADEDREGYPFIPTADAGRVYHELLRDVQLSMSDVYTINLVACWPHMNIEHYATKRVYAEQRDPTRDERMNCRPLWEEVLYRVDPLVIVALGAVTVEELTRDRGVRIGKVRGELLECEIKGRLGPVRYPVMPMYQPSFLARSKDRAVGGAWWKAQQDWRRLVYIVDRMKLMYHGILPPERKKLKKETLFTGGDA